MRDFAVGMISTGIFMGGLVLGLKTDLGVSAILAATLVAIIIELANTFAGSSRSKNHDSNSTTNLHLKL